MKNIITFILSLFLLLISCKNQSKPAFQEECCLELNKLFNEKNTSDSLYKVSIGVIAKQDSLDQIQKLELAQMREVIDSLTTALSIDRLRIRRMHKYVMIYSKDSTQKVFLKGWFNRAIK